MAHALNPLSKKDSQAADQQGASGNHDRALIATAPGGALVGNVQLLDANGDQVGTYSTIQAAINAAGSDHSIVVGSGVYEEQLTIDGKAGLTIRAATGADVTVLAPDNLAVNGDSDYYGVAVRAVIAVTDSSDVRIEDIKVDGGFSGDTSPGSNGDELSGVAFLNSSGGLDSVTIDNVGNSPAGGLFGLQHGSGLFIDNSGLVSGNDVSVTGSTITDFQKTGALIIGADITFTGNTITGIGATGLIGQNGIQITLSQGSLDGNTISGIGYAVPIGGAYYYASGIIAYEPSGALGFDGNTITGVGPAGEFTALDLSDTEGVAVGFTNNIVSAATNGIIAYTYVGGTTGLDTQPDFTGTTFAGITGNGVHFDPEESYGAPFSTATGFTVTGSDFADLLAGSDGNDSFTGGGGADLLTGREGDDSLSGGGGDDTATYAGDRSDYTIAYQTDGGGRIIGFTAVSDDNDGDGDEGADTLTSVETLEFGDITLDAGQPVHLLDGSNNLVGTFATIQAAVNAAADGYTIEVGAGTYVEQVVVDNIDNLTIKAATGAQVTIQAPADLVETGRSGSDREIHGVLTVKNSLDVVIDDIDIDGDGRGNTVDEGGGAGQANFYGVFYRNSSGTLLDVDITGVRDPYPGGTAIGGEPIVSGAQRGVGIVVDNDALLAFTMTGGSIADFQKNATVFNRVDLDMSGVTITGGGAQTINAQNGIQISNSTGSISGNTITGIGYAGTQVVYSAAVLAFGNTDLDITGNTITGANQDTLAAQVVGIYVVDFGTPNNGGEISGNAISHTDTGIAVYGGVTPNGILIQNNTITDLDVTDPYGAGVDFEPTASLATVFDVDGSAGADILHGAAGGDTLTGLGGDDMFQGNGGNDTLAGDGGNDTATYAGASADYTIAYETDADGRVTGFTAVTDNNDGDGDDGADTLTGIEAIEFSDMTFDAGQPVQLFDGSDNFVASYDAIQAAVDASSAGYTIRVAAGTFTENVNFHTAVTVLGAHAGDAGSTRVGADAAGETTLIGRHDITAATGAVVLDGLRFVNNSATTNGGASDPILQIVTGGDHEVTNSVFYSEVAGGARPSPDDRAISMPVIADGTITISDNYFTGASTGGFSTASWGRAIWFDGGGVDLSVTGNTFEYSRTGLNMDLSGDSQANVSGNLFTTTGTAMAVGVDMVGLTVTDNDFSNAGEEFNFRNQNLDVTFDAEIAVDAQSGSFIDVLGGSGNDHLSGTSYGDLLDGNQLSPANPDNDTLDGRGGADVLLGRAGNDILIGGDGNDLIDGGVGLDTAQFAGALSFADTFVGWVVTSGEGTDFLQNTEIAVAGSGQRSLLVGATGFAGVQAAFDNAQSGDHVRLASGTYTGTYTFTDTGLTVFGSSATISATFASAAIGISVFAGDGNDTITTSGGNDVLHGGGGNDTLFGAGGNDSLTGGTGVDAMHGGAGDDFYFVDTSGDSATETAGQGFDVVWATGAYTLATGSDIEVLSARFWEDTSALNLTGNEIVNTLIGNAGANRLHGGGGNDIINGREGDDVLFGDAGADTMNGGQGNDIYVVEQSGDAVFENAGEGTADVIFSAVSYTLPENSEIEVLSARFWEDTTNINLTGSSTGNILIGNAGANILNGAAGADNMSGREGNDIYVVDNVGDVVSEMSSQGFDIVFSSVSYALAAGSEVEVLSSRFWEDSNALDLTGNGIANSIYGNAGANVLDGGGGNDRLQGFGGADTFAFTTVLGAGNADTIADFSAADDSIALDDAVFAGLSQGALNPNAFVTGTAALDADDRIVYNNATGALYYDADGNGAGAAVHFATLQGAPIITASDFMVI